MQLKPDTTLQNDKYRIIRVLGQGGFGITYLAQHTMLDKQVAIKEFFPKGHCSRDNSTSHVSVPLKDSLPLHKLLKTKFIKEAKNISKLRHSNIITIYDIFEENSTAYYVMEYIDGKSLQGIVNDNGPLKETKALDYIIKIADAMGYMHNLSMNHLDLKPANIMIRKDDNEPILIDFGLSKQYDSTGDETSTPMGISNGYAPIEQYKPGGVSTFTPQTDIYSLGATLFALLTGETPPHYSDILEDGLPELPGDVSSSTKEAVNHAMKISKNKRPENIAVFLKELNKARTCLDDSLLKEMEGNTQEDRLIYPEETMIIQAEVEQTEVEPKAIETGKSTNRESIFDENDDLKEMGETMLAPCPLEIPETNNLIINGIEFVDLGLSVKWATQNIGAKMITDTGKFIDSSHIEETKIVYDYNLQGARIPTIGQWGELRNNCHWEWTEIDETWGYKVTGHNGNWIFLPLSGGEENTKFKIFGRLYSREAFYNKDSIDAINYYFYFAFGGVYQLTKYGLNFNCPVRLVYE